MGHLAVHQKLFVVCTSMRAKITKQPRNINHAEQRFAGIIFYLSSVTGYIELVGIVDAYLCLIVRKNKIIVF